MADAHYYREGAQPRVRADSCTPLSRIVWGCQSRTPPPHTHTHTERHTHTHFTPVAIHIGKKSLTSEVKKWKNIPQKLILSSKPQQSSLFSSSSSSRIDVILQRCVIMKYAVHPLTCVAIKSPSIKLILTDMTPFHPITAVWHLYIRSRTML